MQDRILHEKFMRIALDEAQRAFDEGEIPIGAVIVRGEDVIARARNTKEYLKDPTAHAEINVIIASSVVLSKGECSQCTL